MKENLGKGKCNHHWDICVLVEAGKEVWRDWFSV